MSLKNILVSCLLFRMCRVESLDLVSSAVPGPWRLRWVNLRLRGGSAVCPAKSDSRFVTFNVRCQDTRWGQSVGVIGSDQALNNWISPIPMTCENTWPVWSVKLPVSCQTKKIEYKYVKTLEHKTIIEWEQGPNRYLELPSGSQISEITTDDGSFGCPSVQGQGKGIEKQKDFKVLSKSSDVGQGSVLTDAATDVTRAWAENAGMGLSGTPLDGSEDSLRSISNEERRRSDEAKAHLEADRARREQAAAEERAKAEAKAKEAADAASRAEEERRKAEEAKAVAEAYARELAAAAEAKAKADAAAKKLEEEQKLEKAKAEAAKKLAAEAEAKARAEAEAKARAEAEAKARAEAETKARAEAEAKARAEAEAEAKKRAADAEAKSRAEAEAKEQAAAEVKAKAEAEAKAKAAAEAKVRADAEAKAKAAAEAKAKAESEAASKSRAAEADAGPATVAELNGRVMSDRQPTKKAPSGGGKAEAAAAGKATAVTEQPVEVVGPGGKAAGAASAKAVHATPQLSQDEGKGTTAESGAASGLMTNAGALDKLGLSRAASPEQVDEASAAWKVKERAYAAFHHRHAALVKEENERLSRVSRAQVPTAEEAAESLEEASRAGLQELKAEVHKKRGGESVPPPAVSPQHPPAPSSSQASVPARAPAAAADSAAPSGVGGKFPPKASPVATAVKAGADKADADRAGPRKESPKGKLKTTVIPQGHGHAAGAPVHGPKGSRTC